MYLFVWYDVIIQWFFYNSVLKASVIFLTPQAFLFYSTTSIHATSLLLQSRAHPADSSPFHSSLPPQGWCDANPKGQSLCPPHMNGPWRAELVPAGRVPLKMMLSDNVNQFCISLSHFRAAGLLGLRHWKRAVCYPSRSKHLMVVTVLDALPQEQPKECQSRGRGAGAALSPAPAAEQSAAWRDVPIFMRQDLKPFFFDTEIKGNPNKFKNRSSVVLQWDEPLPYKLPSRAGLLDFSWEPVPSSCTGSAAPYCTSLFSEPIVAVSASHELQNQS